jgi:hypothetical protein
MKIAIVVEDRIKDRLEPIFYLYTLNKRIENEIEYRVKML